MSKAPRLKMLGHTVPMLAPRLAPQPPPSRASDYRLRGRAGVAARDRIRRRDNGLCQACLDRHLVTPGTEVDHIVPLSKGGADIDSNKRLLCVPCHVAKTANDLRL